MNAYAFKLKRLILLIFIAASLSVHSYTDVQTIFECYDCIQNQGNLVCRDERTYNQAYCCGKTETSTRGCTGRDFCSSNMKTLSM